ncbi:hypothetical protein D3C83_41820 [compost metagenome]
MASSRPFLMSRSRSAAMRFFFTSSNLASCGFFRSTKRTMWNPYEDSTGGDISPFVVIFAIWLRTGSTKELGLLKPMSPPLRLRSGSSE